jgi:outer membrane lipoprotein SlyB
MIIKKHGLILATAVMTVLLSGCVNPNGSPNNTGSGALMGGAMGALTGAAIGARGHAGPDALIGAAAGALAGGLIGHAADQEQAAQLKAQAPQTYARVDQGTTLSVADVKAMAKAGVSEEVVINQIKNSRKVFHLSVTDIIELRDAGVTDKVVAYMINTPSAVGATTYVQTVPATTYYYQPYYYPAYGWYPPVVFGFGWHGGWRR